MTDLPTAEEAHPPEEQGAKQEASPMSAEKKQVPRRAPRLPVGMVVPCYNEAKRLPVAEFARHARRHSDQRFLFVNDGSSDATAEVLDKLAAQRPRAFAVLHLSRNGGKAEAVRQGLRWWREQSDRPPLLGYWDADLATPLDEITRMQGILSRHLDRVLVLGSRIRLLGRHIERQALRHYLGRVFATSVSLLLRLPVYDTQCGAKLLRANDKTSNLFEEPFVSPWLFDVEILARVRRLLTAAEFQEGVFELPLREWREVGGSKLRLRHFMQAPWQLLRIGWRYGLFSGKGISR